MDIKAKKLRREGFVTGNVFGREMKESVPVKMDKKEVESLLKKNNKGSQVMLDVDGTKHNVLIKDIQFDPIKKQINQICTFFEAFFCDFFNFSKIYSNKAGAPGNGKRQP